MQVLGYRKVVSLKTSLWGWPDYEQPLEDKSGSPVDLDDADQYFMPQVRKDRLKPAGWSG